MQFGEMLLKRLACRGMQVPYAATGGSSTCRAPGARNLCGERTFTKAAFTSPLSAWRDSNPRKRLCRPFQHLVAGAQRRRHSLTLGRIRASVSAAYGTGRRGPAGQRGRDRPVKHAPRRPSSQYLMNPAPMIHVDRQRVIVVVLVSHRLPVDRLAVGQVLQRRFRLIVGACVKQPYRVIPV